MSVPSEILERIKKLLRLARSSNPHEAQAAMQRAIALAEEYRISIEGLNPDAQAPSLTHEDTESLKKLTYDRKFAALIVQRFFRVRAIARSAIHTVDGRLTLGRKLSFVGSASDIDVALYVYGFLVSHFGFCWRRHRGRVRNRYSYIEGLFQGLYSKLEQAEPQHPNSTGKELAISMDDYVKKHIGETESTSMPNGEAAAARWAGYLQGKNTEIRPAVKAAAPAPLALQ